MLEHIEVENFILIDKISIDFTSALNVITGETGSGKTMLLSALGFLSSAKNAEKVQKDKDKNTTVIAVFSNLDKEVLDFLKEHDIELSNNELVLKRQIKAHSRLSSYIQDFYSSSAFFESLVSLLLNHNSQRSESKLFKPLFATRLLDNYASSTEDFEILKELRAEYQKTGQNYKISKEEYDKNIREKDYLEYVLTELDKAELKIGEDDDLKEKLKMIKNSALVKTEMQNIFNIFAQNSQITNFLHSSMQSAQHLAKIDTSFSKISEKINDLYYLIEDIRGEVVDFKDKVNFDSSEEEEITDRLDLIARLKRKYSDSIEGCIKFRDETRKKLEEMEDFDTKIEFYKSALSTLEDKIKTKSDELYKKRIANAKKLEEKVTKSLHLLSMQNAQFLVAIDKSDDFLKDDNVEFLISTTKSSPLLPVNKIASGGEISRIFLSLLSVDDEQRQTQIFDEIDSGIGGETASDVGKFIFDIAQKRQVIAITHQASISCFGENHICVSKKEEKGYTCVEAKVISDKERVDEVARMLSGKRDEISIAHAASLLAKTNILNK